MRLSRAAGIALAVAAMVFPIARADAGAEIYWSEFEDTAIFEAALTASGLRPALGRDDVFTLFLPSDGALEREGSAGLLRGVYLTSSNRARLADLLAYHIVPGRKIIPASTAPVDVITLSGDTLSIEGDGDRPVLNGHIAVTRSIDLGNGVVHLVSGLLWADLEMEEKDLASDTRAVPTAW